MLSLVCIVGVIEAAAAMKPSETDHCTAIAAGPGATLDGSAFVGQSVDAEGGPGTSIKFVPAQNHAPGSSRPVYDQATGRQIGSVPQVPHTYAYTWGKYGLMNEHQLAFGESTCSGRIAAKSLAANGTALFSNTELTKLALERCKSARCAIQLMGKTAMQDGGFYGENSAVPDGAETLVVADPTEAWVFHILADPTGRSAIWGAQRVPDDKVAFVPNVFVIRDMDFHSDDFMISSNAVAIAREFGWWEGPPDTFDFSGAFSVGEYANPYYSARRLWRAFDLVAPSLQLDPTQEITDTNAGYPFAVKPDKLLTAADVFRVYRDYYEGTPYSLVKDEVAAGPFNSPRRIAKGLAEESHPGTAWERPISIYRADFVCLNVVRGDGHGIVWIAPHIPHASVFAPAWTSVATTISPRFAVDKTLDVDRGSLFWAVSAVANWAHGSMFNRAIIDIRRAQVVWDQQAQELEAILKNLAAVDHNSKLLGFADNLHTAWWNLFWSLMAKYSDGYVVTRDEHGTPTPESIGCPSWYLDAVHFDKALDAKGSSFQAQASRLAHAAKVYAEIDAKRKYPASVMEAAFTV